MSLQKTRRQDGLNVPGGIFCCCCCCCVCSRDFLEDDGRALELSANRCGVFNGSSSCLTTRGSQEANFRNERLQSSGVVFLFFWAAEDKNVLFFELEGNLIIFVM